MKLCAPLIRQVLLFFLAEGPFSYSTCDRRVFKQLDGYSLYKKKYDEQQALVPVEESEPSVEKAINTLPPTEPPTTMFYSMKVSSTSDAYVLSEKLESAAPGSVFNVRWIGAVEIKATIGISNGVFLNVTGSSARESKVDGLKAHRLFNVDQGSSLHLANISLARGSGEKMISAPNGGAVYLTDGSSLMVLDSVFDSNVASSGGAIFAIGSNIMVDGRTLFFNNRATRKKGGVGGAICGRPSTFGSKTPSLRLAGHVSFEGNSASSYGGAFELRGGDIVLDGSASFLGNNAGSNGGAIFIDKTEMLVDGELLFSKNTASKGGGAIFINRAGITVNGGLSCSNNTAGRFGGAIQLKRGSVLVGGTTRLHTNVAAAGGAIFSFNRAGTREIKFGGTIDIHGNNASSGSGGAIYASGTTLETRGKVLFTSNTAHAYGGTLFARSNSRVIIAGDTNFVGNTAGKEGDVIFANASATVIINREEHDGVIDEDVYLRYDESLSTVKDEADGYNRGGDDTGVDNDIGGNSSEPGDNGATHHKGVDSRTGDMDTGRRCGGSVHLFISILLVIAQHFQLEVDSFKQEG